MLVNVESEDTTEETPEFDLMFPVIPTVDDPSPPDDYALELVDDVEDFAADELAGDDVLAEQIDRGDDWAIDWATGELWHLENGEPERVTGDQAILERLQKALYTPRGEFAIYSDAYGSDLHTIIGASATEEVKMAEIHRTIRECGAAVGGVQRAEVTSIAPMGMGAWHIAVDVVLEGNDNPVQLDLTI